MDQRQWSSQLTSSTSEHATFVNLKDEHLYSNCATEPDKKCLFDYTPYADIMPRYLQLNGFVQGEYRNNDITYYTQILGGFKRSQYFYAPIPVNSGAKPSIQVEADHHISEVQRAGF